MRYTILALLTIAFCFALVSSNPLPENGLRSETLDRLMMAETDNEEALRSKRTIGILRQLFPDISQDVNPESENRVNQDTAESQNNEVRVQFADEKPKESEELTPLSENETDENNDENRDKRGSTGTGGSTNIIFDVLRQAADGAARAAGTVFRVIVGTQSLGLGLSASRNVNPTPQQAAPAATNSTPMSGAPSTAAPGASIPPLSLIQSGSGSSEENPIIGPTQGMTMAIPGPFTRLLLIANRGWADLIEDVVLRLARTSEKFVDYKATFVKWLI